MAIPAGFYSDDDLSEDGFEYFSNVDIPKTIKPVPLTNEEQLRRNITNHDVAGVIDLLRRSSINLNEPQGSSEWVPLIYAASVHNISMIDALIDHGADVNYAHNRETPLMTACNTPDLPCVKRLVEAGARVHDRDKYGTNALMIASMRGNLDVVMYLLGQRLDDLNVTDAEGWTALFHAVNANALDVVLFLLEAGAERGVDIRGQTAYDLALSKNLTDIVDVLETDVEERADVVSFVPDYRDNFRTLRTAPAYVHDLEVFLTGLKMEHRLGIFLAHAVTFPQLLTMSDGELETIGIIFQFERKRILHACYQFHVHAWRKTTIPQPTKREFTETRDVFNAIANCAKHVEIMTCGLTYLNRRSANACVNGAGKCRAAIATLRGDIVAMRGDLRRMQEELLKVSNEQATPPDFIPPNRKLLPRSVLVKMFMKFALVGFVSVALLKYGRGRV